MSAAPRRVGVVGAGTMGAGIAQVAALAGMETVLHDPFPDALDRGVERIRSDLAKGAERQRWSPAEAAAAEARVEPAGSLEGLGGCELVVEAAPEQPDLKRELFARLSSVLGRDAIIASNTSSLQIASLAPAAERPGRVVGMHFFNPPPLMRLLEVVAGPETSPKALAVARATGEAMGKRVVIARDGPGFLVNRCGRPFYTEAFRILDEGSASVDQIDRVCRLGGGFRMGPFELMDLVGIDVGLGVAKSFAEQSFGEPRWRPSPTQARMVASGRLGRKTGRGYYDYSQRAYRPDDPEPPPTGGDPPTVAIEGSGPLATELRARAERAALRVRGPSDAADAELFVDARPAGSPPPASGAPAVVLCAGASLAQRGPRGACGFHLLPPLDGARLVELTRLPDTDPPAAEAAERFFGALGFSSEWVEDAPGLILGRIVAQLVNEAGFALGEGVGSAADIDAGLEVGLNHPRGPIAWGEAMGLEHALGTIDALWEERREERYRAAPLLRRAVATGENLRGLGRAP